MNTYAEYREGKKKMRKLIKEFMGETDKEKTNNILNEIDKLSTKQAELKEKITKNKRRFFKRNKS